MFAGKLRGMSLKQQRDLLDIFTKSAGEVLDAWFEGDAIKVCATLCEPAWLRIWLPCCTLFFGAGHARLRCGHWQLPVAVHTWLRESSLDLSRSSLISLRFVCFSSGVRADSSPGNKEEPAWSFRLRLIDLLCSLARSMARKASGATPLAEWAQSLR
jgi:hypothetical protein